MTVQDLRQFYALMHRTAVIRRDIASRILRSEPADEYANPLREALQALRDIPREKTVAGGSTHTPGDLYRLSSGKQDIYLELSYEIDELERDIRYVTDGEEALLADLRGRNPRFQDETKRLVDDLRGIRFVNFITDRDGTVNNYCGRYRSSVQSSYNAVFLTRFLRRMRNPVLLTSAPLRDFGLLDLSVLPQGSVVYAGSKGREYLTRNGEYRTYPVDAEKQGMLDRLNRRLEKLLATPEFQVYGMIGSGLQFKFGQTTVSRQDINNSVPAQESELFLNVIKNLVRDLDPERRYFRIEDTGKDIEIILTIRDPSRPGELKDFDKGDGVKFLNHELGLELSRGPNLVCGDTRSDIQMARASAEAARETWSVFVTVDQELRESLQQVSPNALFVSAPDVLVTALSVLGQNGGTETSDS
jgi:hypothetical protein